MKTLRIIILLVILVSCKTVYVKKDQQKAASSNLELATIGENKPNLQINSFEVHAIPKLSQKIRVNATLLEFSKATYRAFKKATKFQGNKNNVKYIDSLVNKPTFVELNIMDKVTLLEVLNKSLNAEIIDYLKYTPKAKIVTTISIVFDLKEQNEINQSDEIYISNSKNKKYNLELYKNKKLVTTIDFSKGTVLSYKLSTFCWAKNNKNGIGIVKIIDNNSKCTINTSKRYQKLEHARYSIKF